MLHTGTTEKMQTKIYNGQTTTAKNGLAAKTSTSCLDRQSQHYIG